MFSCQGKEQEEACDSAAMFLVSAVPVHHQRGFARSAPRATFFVIVKNPKVGQGG